MKLPELPSNKIKDIRGERFGRLLVTAFSHIASHKGRNAFWKCLCDCGKEHTVDSGALRTGSTKSCGCLASETSKDLIKKTHTKGRHLYLIQSGQYTKIGRANRPDLRLVQINASNPFGAKLIHVFENKGELEHAFHEEYKHVHHYGEWFMLAPSHIDDICRSCEIT